MIFLVWEYRMGMVVRERTMWPDYLAAKPADERIEHGADVYALARAVREQTPAPAKTPVSQ